MKETKEKLRQTATELFAKYGIDGVSTRDLAKMSGVNLCAINYYFGTKQKLYETILEEIGGKIITLVSAKQLPLQNQNLSAAEEIKLFVCNMFDFLCSDVISSTQSELVVKELVNPTDTYNRLYKQVIEPLHKRLTALVMQITGKTEREAAILVHCMMGQVVMFRMHKEALLRRLEVTDYDAALADDIKKQIVRNCEMMLTGGKQ